MAIKSFEKDALIARLRQDLYDLKNMERDYEGVSEEIIRSENLYRRLREDKTGSDREARLTLDQDFEEIAVLRKQAEELKQLLVEKDQSNY